MSEQSKCPFTGAGTPPKFPTGRGTSNRDWWPNNLNLKILSHRDIYYKTFTITVPRDSNSRYVRQSYVKENLLQNYKT